MAISLTTDGVQRRQVGRSTTTCWATVVCDSDIANQLEIEGDMLDVQRRPIGRSTVFFVVI
jgi:hypothetical protein